MYERNDSLGIDPFWTYHLHCPIPYLPKSVGCNFVESPKKPEVKYRFLTEGKVIRAGDECLFWDGTYRIYDCQVGRVMDKAFEVHKDYRRPIRMQDATHRYLDVGESIKHEDEVNSRGLNSWHYTFRAGEEVRQVDADVGQLYRRKLEETAVEQPKPETKAALADDYNYRYLKAGEITKEGDEVDLGVGLKVYWEKCRNGNVNAVVTKSHETQRLYRRPKTLTGPVNSVSQDLEAENETLKDQLANSMAEVNELKEKLRDTEVAVNVYKKLQQLLGVGDRVTTTVFAMIVEIDRLKEKLEKYEPQYVYLKAGDLIQEGDEYQSDFDYRWCLSYSAGKHVGDGGTCNYDTLKPYNYRRKVK